MHETMKVFLTIAVLIGVFILTFYVAGVRMKKAGDFILRDLEKKRALDPASAVELPYCKESWLRFGLRDYRPKALGALLQSDLVAAADGERYYLKQGQRPNRTGGGAAAS